jgi:peptidoglycan/LPS O-acetylase OafA/YrhL
LSDFISVQKLPPISVFLLFVSNFFVIQNGEEFLFALLVLWSVSVEEQFYIAWAFCLRFFKKYLNPIALMLILASLLFRAYALSDQKLLYFHTVSTLSNFSVGALVAYSCQVKGSFYQTLYSFSKKHHRPIYFLFLTQVVFYNPIYSLAIFQIFERLIFSVFFAFVIFDFTFGAHSKEKKGIWKFFTFLGKASFGLYCFHALVISLFIQWVNHYKFEFSLFQTVFINPLILLMITIGTALLSFEYFEKYFLRLKHKFYSFKAN